MIRLAVRQAMRSWATSSSWAAPSTRRWSAPRKGDKRYRYSYDMLGEGALTAADADALPRRLPGGDRRDRPARVRGGRVRRAGISVKLSALHPRYEHRPARARDGRAGAARGRARAAGARGGIGFTIDAEEADRLELSLDLIERRIADPSLAAGKARPRGAGLPEARAVRDRLARRPRAPHRPPHPVRLVKGAYWDSEIKRAQVDGLAGYPVFTRKANTDVSYLACARGAARRATRSIRSSPPTTPTPSPRSIDSRGEPARDSSSSACTAWARRCTTR